MLIGVIKEQTKGEKRVAATPDIAQNWLPTKLKFVRKNVPETAPGIAMKVMLFGDARKITEQIYKVLPQQTKMYRKQLP